MPSFRGRSPADREHEHDDEHDPGAASNSPPELADIFTDKFLTQIGPAARPVWDF